MWGLLVPSRLQVVVFNQGRTDELIETSAALDSERHSYPISLSPLDRIGSGGGLMGSGACTYDIGAEQR